MRGHDTWPRPRSYLVAYVAYVLHTWPTPRSYTHQTRPPYKTFYRLLFLKPKRGREGAEFEGKFDGDRGLRERRRHERKKPKAEVRAIATV